MKYLHVIEDKSSGLRILPVWLAAAARFTRSGGPDLDTGWSVVKEALPSRPVSVPRPEVVDLTNNLLYSNFPLANKFKSVRMPYRRRIPAGA
jgi:hypothetical protein